MSRFEDNLWESVVERHGDDLSRTDVAAAKRPRRTLARPRVLAGATLGLAVIGAALALALGNSSTPPAFAVIRHRDGSVSVKINRRSGIPAANRQLAAMGIRERTMAVDDNRSIPRNCMLGSAPAVAVPTPGELTPDNAGARTAGPVSVSVSGRVLVVVCLRSAAGHAGRMSAG